MPKHPTTGRDNEHPKGPHHPGNQRDVRPNEPNNPADDPDHPGNQNGQPSNPVGDPEGVVVAQGDLGTHPAEPLPRQPPAHPKKPNNGEQQPNGNRDEREQMHAPMVSGRLGDTCWLPSSAVLLLMRALRVLLSTTVAFGLVAAPATAERPAVRLLGERIIPPGQFLGTTVGGFSGIDRDPRTGGYVLISDDRSDRQPARFYTARIGVSASGLGEVRLTGTHPFLRPDGTTYPRGTVDPEDIRVDPWTRNYLWSQEGERIVQPDRQVLIDPSIQAAQRDGEFARALPLPDNERMSAEQRGPRQNQALEALTFAAGGTLVVSALEGALFEDGPEATPAAGTTSRITVQTRAGRLLAQYAYRQEPVFANPDPPGSFATNGVTAILEVTPSRYLVLERAFVTGVGNKVRLFAIDLHRATNVAGKALDGAVPVRKRLVVDFDDLGLSTVDNVEGMTWGPRLRTGARTLLLVSDDNFASNQVTQVIALALR